MDTQEHPMQPLVVDKTGVVRFKENKIVRALLDTGKLDLNDIGRLPFSDEDRRQLAQLIGYSVSGYGELSYVDDAAWALVSQAVERLADGLPVTCSMCVRKGLPPRSR